MYLQYLHTVILTWVKITLTGAVISTPCSTFCKCNEIKHTMDCNGKGRVLTSMPRPPIYVRSFQLSNSSLGRMTELTMRNLAYCKLIIIRLKDNNITSISPDALSGLKILKILEWKQGNLPISELEDALQKVKSPLSNLTIYAQHLDTQTVSASSFQHLNSLRSLRLHAKEIKAFNTSGLWQMKQLKLLDLDDNQLGDFSLEEVVPALEILSLKENDLVSMPSLCHGSKPLTPKLWYIILQNNAIRHLDTSGLSCLENLAKIDLSQNRIEYLHDNTFANLQALLELNLSRMTSLKSVADLSFNSSTLTKLILNENPVLTLKKCNLKILFKHTPNLTNLDMTSTKLVIKPDDLKQLLLTLSNIEHLTLQRTNIHILPVGVFSRLPHLKKLTLSGNYFSGWDNEVFANVTSIKQIFLEGNNIKTVNETSFPIEFRLSVREINLSNNPYTCTCELRWFRDWIKEARQNKSIKFTNFPYRYECRSPNVHPLHLEDYNPTLASCTINEIYFVILVIVLSACLVLTVVSLVAYRYRWYILYWISLMRRRRQRQQQREGPPAEMQYDGFVSYSNPDWDWVSAEVVDFLEGQVGMRLCEHSRDFKVGMYIVDNVIDAIDTGRKTILVISNEYMKSDWCQFELKMALNLFLEKEIDIIVILLENIKSREVNSALRALMVSTTYLEWSDDEEAKRLFRERLQNAMREQ